MFFQYRTGAPGVKERAFLVVISLTLCACALADLGTTLTSTTPVHTGKIYESIVDTYQTCRIRVFHENRTVPEDHNKPEVFCAKLPDMNECFLQEEINWNETHSLPERKGFVLYRQLWEDTMDRLCGNNGGRLNNLVMEYNNFTQSLDKGDKLTFYFGSECFHMIVMMLPVIDHRQVNLASKMWSIYRQFQRQRDCFDRHRDMGSYNITYLQEEVIAILEIMKCLSPQDEEIIPCSEVDATMIDVERICYMPIGNRFPNDAKLLVKETMGCAKARSIDSRVSRAKTFKQFQRYFERFCSDIWFPSTQCYALISGEANLCLHEHDYKQFQLFRSYLELLRDTGCAENGNSLATLFYRFQVVKNSTGEATTAMTDCLRGTLVGDSGSLDVNGYYNELPGIKQCLVDMMPGDTAFETVLDGMYNTIREGMKCPEPDKSSVKLCKDIV